MIEDFIKVADVPQKLVARYEERLPEEVLGIWRDYSFGTLMTNLKKESLLAPVLALLATLCLVLCLSSCATTSNQLPDERPAPRATSEQLPYLDKEKSYFNDFKVMDDTVIFSCHLVLINPNVKPVTLEIVGDFSEDVRGGLLAEGELFAHVLGDSQVQTFLLEPGSSGWIDVEFSGPRGTGTSLQKQDRLLPQIEIRPVEGFTPYAAVPDRSSFVGMYAGKPTGTIRDTSSIEQLLLVTPGEEDDVTTDVGGTWQATNVYAVYLGPDTGLMYVNCSPFCIETRDAFYIGGDTLALSQEQVDAIRELLDRYHVRDWDEDYSEPEAARSDDTLSWTLALWGEETLEKHCGAGSDLAQITPTGYQQFVAELDGIVGNDVLREIRKGKGER